MKIYMNNLFQQFGRSSSLFRQFGRGYWPIQTIFRNFNAFFPFLVYQTGSTTISFIVITGNVTVINKVIRVLINPVFNSAIIVEFFLFLDFLLFFLIVSLASLFLHQNILFFLLLSSLLPLYLPIYYLYLLLQLLLSLYISLLVSFFLIRLLNPVLPFMYLLPPFNLITFQI